MDSQLVAGFNRHQQGDLAGAEVLYQQVLAANPRQADALHLSGVIAMQRGQPDRAVTLIQQAIALQPGNASFFSNCAEAYRQLGQLEAALACLQNALALRPDFPEAFFNSANIYAALRQWPQAVEAYRNALRLVPQSVENWNNLGLALQEMAQWQEAEKAFRQALAVRPDFVQSWANLGQLLSQQGGWQEGVACFEKALALAPNKPELFYNLGNLYLSHDQLNQAEKCFRQALAAHFINPAVLGNFGLTLRRLGRWQEAEVCCRQAIALDPGHGKSHLNLGHLLQQLGRLAEAEEHFLQARQLSPDQGASWENLGNLHFDQKRLAEALHCFNEAVRLTPNDAALLAKRLHVAMHQCDWQDFNGRWQTFLKIWGDRPQTAIDPFILVALPATPGQQLLASCNHAASQGVKPVTRLANPRPLAKEVGRRLRVGYLSGDFRDHPTSFLIMEVLEHHDRRQFDILGYDYGQPASGATRQRLENCFSPMVSIGSLSMEEAVNRIRQDGIDILVDLMGFIKGARLGILARRPAPLQVHWLAYPGTLGGGVVDYLIADRQVIPPGWEEGYGEALIFMPDSYQPNDRQRTIGPTPSRQECGLPEEGLVFCSFNQTYKITPDWFAIWMNLLKQRPGSFLWQLDGGPVPCHNLTQAAGQHGVDPARLIFAPRLTLAQHLGRMAQADIMLDTFPCNGHTTVSDALWVGVPTITRSGTTFPSRVAGSLLKSAGLPQLITNSDQEYEQLALALTAQPDKLQEMRLFLQKNRLTCPLFDSSRYTRHLEEAYRSIWLRHQAGWEPEDLAVGVGEVD